MDEGAALRLTTALYFTRNGRSIQAEGVTPDVVVQAQRFPKDSEELLEGSAPPSDESVKERDLPGALPNPKSSPAKAKSPATPAGRGAANVPPPASTMITMDLAELLKQDPQLNEALHLLKTWTIFKAKPASQQPTVSPSQAGA